MAKHQTTRKIWTMCADDPAVTQFKCSKRSEAPSDDIGMPLQEYLNKLNNLIPFTRRNDNTNTEIAPAWQGAMTIPLSREEWLCTIPSILYTAREQQKTLR